jgi:hypothetical protein
VQADRSRHRQLALLIVAALLFNAPVLAVADRLALLPGVPLTPVYLFSAWLAVILLCALNLRERRP